MKQSAISILLLSAILIFASIDALSVTRQVPAQYSSIQSAIDACSNGDTVLVADGTYYETIRFNGKKIMVASTYLTTGDTSRISHTIIDGSGQLIADSASVVYFISGEDTNSVLCGFTVRGGTGTSFGTFREGGGVLVRSGGRLVRNIITGNTVSGGDVYAAGVAGEGGQILVLDSNTISGNILNGSWAAGGGVGIYDMIGIVRHNTISDNSVTTLGSGSGSHAAGLDCELGTFTIEGNLISGNRALATTALHSPSYGGGVIIRAAAATFRNNRIIGNLLQTSTAVRAYGGGVCLLAANASETSEITLTSNYIASNTVIGGWAADARSGGGGISCVGQSPRIENNIIVRNVAPYGGGIEAATYTGSAAATQMSHIVTRREPRVPVVMSTASHISSIPIAPILINNTISYNRATLNGGAVVVSGSWTPTVFNTIAWGDTGTEEIFLGAGSTISVTFSDIKGGYPGIGNLDSDPRYLDSTYQIGNPSKCIGAGTDSVQAGGLWYKPPVASLTGIARPSPAGSHPDIGACENILPAPIPDGVDGHLSFTPANFELAQSYPNPFNPNADIRYQIAEFRMVRLAVYDILGREVAVLVNEKKAPGVYTVRFDATRLASGVYLYRLSAGSYTEIRKMVLVR